jgi:hypothetical protein
MYLLCMHGWNNQQDHPQSDTKKSDPEEIVATTF